MRKKTILILLITICIAFAMISSASAVDVGKVNVKSFGSYTVNLTNAPDAVKKPTSYGRSVKFVSSKSQETVKNTYNTRNLKGVNARYTFKTTYFLPSVWKKGKSLGTVESSAIKGNYLYTLVLVKHNSNKGFIVRYNMKILNKEGLNKSGDSAKNLRRIGMLYKNGNTKLSAKLTRIAKAVKVGPTFTTGHGQSLSLNPKDGNLYMWQDTGSSDNLKILKIDPNKIKPVKSYSFKMWNTGSNSYVRGVHDLAFDKDGNFYVEIVYGASKNLPTGAIKIYQGTITGNKITGKQAPSVISRGPGAYKKSVGQGIGINPVTNRLFILTDGAFYSMPINKLMDGTLTKEDMGYTILGTVREFESITFDSKGTAYLFVLRGSEILQSKDPYVGITS
ncbi:hypothetical protein [Methanobrevibacter filiformis]|uniref:Uncharacterized protein n=1 Tax=Methanobrevibacter filiformis TaxID=55758 RepID=A0A166F3U8_9EURY|nr:hypothetical protein [Methanobrevibacter filiformis]KZX17288.1 hypothetical protein MBFIL_02610 [Methanobrevibacter filiformis]